MFDASVYDFEENVRRTAAYVKEAQSRVVVEACPDKIYERDEMRKKQLRESDLLSRPDMVERFVRETGIDLIVPNLGTEHRSASTEPLEYRRELAQEIARRVGPMQALHGTSSLGGRLGAVGPDGICKINYYTAMARASTHAVREAWAATPVGGALPIALACGSFLHRTRRESIAANVGALLTSLAGPCRE
jgi:fructose-bisphosphate aldolase class II